MPDVSYVPGALIAVAGDRCLAVVEAAPDSAVTTWIWQRVAEGTPAEALLADLLGGGFEGVGGFALLDGLAARQRRLFCRGAVAATVEGGNVSARIDGIGLLTWREYTVAPDAERIVLGEPPADHVLRQPATPGVLLASCVVIDLTSAAIRDTLRYDSPVDRYDAPVDEPSIGDSGAGPAVTLQPDTIATVRVIAQQVQSRPPGGLIDAVTWGPGPDAPLAPARPGEAEFTVKRAEQPVAGEAARASRSAAATDWIGPSVPALICPAGHLNPPSQADCRQCGAALPNDVVVAPRPVLGVLRLSTGDVVTLDRGVVMGRNPRTDFVGAEAGQGLHAVSLPSADGDISRTHLLVTLNGWHVLVTDLNSTNGTLVALPGRDPEQLRPGEPVPIKPGTVVTLADGIDFRYEVDA
jgi:hypothetical protein